MRFLQAIIVLSALSFATVSAQPAAGRPKLLAVEVTRPNIVVHGAYLIRVEIWAVPAGTGITPDKFVLLHCLIIETATCSPLAPTSPKLSCYTASMVRRSYFSP